jgi:PST family polysaccharide transporter
MTVGLFVGVWIARYLGPVQFGQFSYAMALVAVFGVVGTLAVDSNVVRDIINETAATNEILGTAAFLKVIGGLIAAALCVWTVLLLRPEDMVIKWLVTILAAGLVFQAVETIALWFQAQVQSKYVVWAKNIAIFVMAVVKVTLILTDAPLIAFAWAGLADTILAMLALLLVYHVRGERISAWRVSLSRAKILLQESWPLLISAITAMLYLRVDMIMLGEMHSEAAVGIYGAATRISEVWYFIPMALVASLQPALVQAKQRSEELFRSRLQNIYALMSALSISVALAVTLLADRLVLLLFGHAYEASGAILAVHVWAAVAVFLGVASSQYLLVENLQKISMYRTTIGLLCNIALNVVLIPKHGAMGAAVATLVSYFLATFSMYFFTQSRQQAVMMLRSLNPVGWRSLVKDQALM